jgi:hypothetical protein
VRYPAIKQNEQSVAGELYNMKESRLMIAGSAISFCPFASSPSYAQETPLSCPDACSPKFL